MPQRMAYKLRTVQDTTTTGTTTTADNDGITATDGYEALPRL